jgi:hypothetical protein
VSFLSGAANLGAGVGALKNIAKELFPDQVSLKFTLDDVEKEIFLDSCRSRKITTSIGVSEFPAEDGRVFQQNVSTNPRSIALSAFLSSIIRLNNLKTGTSAAKYATSLLIPEVASISNILLNEGDTVAERLFDLRQCMNTGTIVQVLGLPDQDVFNFIIMNVDDTESEASGDKGKDIELTLREAEIVGLKKPVKKVDNGLFSKIQGGVSGGLNKAGGAVTGIFK